ncbi:MAG: hypothetical protein IPO78_17265 [Saprospiraceae bacterium]|nr:hypothetical protein [Saprospiraceae bacterium]
MKNTSVTVVTAVNGKFRKGYLNNQKAAMDIQINAMKELGVEYSSETFDLYQRATREKKPAGAGRTQVAKK